MARREYYLITALPGLGELGSSPPVSLGELLEQVSVRPDAADVVRAILLGDDLLQRQAALAGEIEQVAPAVLTVAQARNEEPLPFYLVGEGAEAPPGRMPEDVVWAGYYRHAAQVARRRDSAFLGAWVAHEVAFRNALAEARAKALGLEAAGYLVAPELGGEGEDFAGVITEWGAAPNPLAGLRVLDAARWRWLDEHDPYFTFDIDELAVYAARLMLLHRWHRLAEAQRQRARPPAGSQPSTERTDS